MKAILILLSLFTFAASAGIKETCNAVSDGSDSHKAVKEAAVDLSDAKAADLAKLTQSQTDQLVATARWATKDYSPRRKKVVVNTPEEALKFLQSVSEGEELDLTSFEFEGVVYDKVTFYPGALVGLVFIDDSVSVLGEISDGDLYCEE